MMAWVSPKTNWTAEPLTAIDMNRIEGDQIVLKTASNIDISDPGNYFTTKNVDAALTQLKKWILGV